MRQGQREPRLSTFQVGLIATILAAVFVFWNFTKVNPFANPYEVKAAFQNANNLRTKAPVRIAGVEVGKVSGIEKIDVEGKPGQGAIVTMQIKDAGRPIKTDATAKIRPRLFLEGNFFVDMQPGSPSAPEMKAGDTIPVSHTAAPVQLDELLTALQSDTRHDLKILLKELGDGLVKYGGAEGFRNAIYSSPNAFRDTSRVGEALLGTEPHDLSGLVVNTQKVVSALGHNKVDLQDLVTNFNRVAAALGSQSASLQESVAQLPSLLEQGIPALRKLNAAFPAIRGFARDILPGVRSTGPMLDASQPLVEQLAKLFSAGELGRTANDLQVLAPRLTVLTKRSTSQLEDARTLAGCFNNVIIPWADSKVPDVDHPAQGTVAEETAWGLVGISGESRSGDANGQKVHVLGSGGPNMVQFNEKFGTTLLPILGTNPPKATNAHPPIRYDVPCETQEPPNLATKAGPAPAQRKISDKGPIAQLGLQQMPILKDLMNAQTLRAAGKRSAAETLTKRAHAALRKFNENDLPRLRKLLRAAR